MGITRITAEFILRRKDQRKLGKTVMIGRQGMVLAVSTAVDILKRSQCWPPAIPEERLRNSLEELVCFADDWLLAAGASTVESIDRSDYEGATLLHDMNLPLPEKWKGQYDTVIDCGTLEHIFNVPIAIENYMSLLKPGGRMVLVTLANNCCGHGFYQFSPEFFFRVFAPENGFKIDSVQLAEDEIVTPKIGPLRPMISVSGRIVEVVDPHEVHGRVELKNTRQTVVMVDAEKVKEVKLFGTIPQQSDYVAAWQSAAQGTVRPEGKLKKFLLQNLKPKTLKEIYFRYLPIVFKPIQWLLPTGLIGGYRFNNRRFYRAIE